MFNYFYNVRKYFKFDEDEIKSIFLLIFLFGFVLGYNDGHPEFILGRWLFNLLNSFIIGAIVVLTKEVGHKLMAIKKGYTVKMKLWSPLLIFNFLIVFLLDGNIHIILPISGLFIYHHDKMRIGHLRYGQNYFDNAVIALAGPLANIYMAAFFNFFVTPANPVVALAIQINLIYAIVNLIPIDVLLFFMRKPRQLEKADTKKHPAPFAGTYIFFSTRLFYVFSVTVSIVLAATTYTSGILASTFTAFIVGFLVFFVNWWQHDFDIV